MEQVTGRAGAQESEFDGGGAFAAIPTGRPCSSAGMGPFGVRDGRWAKSLAATFALAVIAPSLVIEANRSYAPTREWWGAFSSRIEVVKLPPR